MKRTVFLIAACLLIGKAAAQPSETEGNSYQQELRQLTPTYLENVFTGKTWDSNWFVSVKGGMSAFTGKPIGHGDLFDRTKLLVHISAGKWFTPYVGGRFAFQGFSLKDANLSTCNFQSVHADFLYNITSHFRQNYDEVPKWDIIPFAGCGIIRNSYTHQKPFAISYGVIGRYRLIDRLHVSAELGATTTFQDFDGQGAGNRFGDHLLQVSVGLDVTLGKVGWSRVIDYKPYLYQNDRLIEYAGKLRDENTKLNRMHKKDAMALTEMRKILEIEGLLDKYNLAMTPGDENERTYPRNNYSGLNSLRARLRNKGWNGNINEYNPVLANRTDSVTTPEATPEEYFKIMQDGKIFVGAPIYFFFKIGTDELTEKAQIINIKEVANVILKYGLHARIVGAADSQTGTAYTNERLSAQRADYIASLMKKQGVSEQMIETQHRGGISSYEPLTGNRNTCIMLYFK